MPDRPDDGVTVPDRFVFAFDPRYAPLLRLAGIRHDNSEVVVTDDELLARFGPWTLRTSLSNVVEASVTGPHLPIRAIGTRLSLSDRGLTFGSNVDRTVCIRFRTPVAGLEPLGVLRHPNLTVSVADPEGLVARLTAGRA